MKTYNPVSLTLSKKLKEKGYRKYTETQYVYSKKDEKYVAAHLNLENCAIVELYSGNDILYAPELLEAYKWILEQDSNWVVSVLWDNNFKGFYFMVQNIETGYEYKQPATPNELNRFKMFEWGLEHVLNRLVIDKINTDIFLE